ncbi:MAG: hypothetical protein HY000_05440 [Planctomycetes bacterium]|nr:hypothetical protein [Planctomycetota bacterium]
MSGTLRSRVRKLRFEALEERLPPNALFFAGGGVRMWGLAGRLIRS